MGGPGNVFVNQVKFQYRKLLTLLDWKEGGLEHHFWVGLLCIFLIGLNYLKKHLR